MTPAELKTKLIALRLRAEGFDSQMQLACVRQVAPRSPLTAEDTIEWRRPGILDDVLREALARKAEASIVMARPQGRLGLLARPRGRCGWRQ